MVKVNVLIDNKLLTEIQILLPELKIGLKSKKKNNLDLQLNYTFSFGLNLVFFGLSYQLHSSYTGCVLVVKGFPLPNENRSPLFR